MVCQAVNAPLGEVLSTGFAGVRVSIAVVGELGATLKVLQDEAIRSPAHCDIQEFPWGTRGFGQICLKFAFAFVAGFESMACRG